VDPLYCTRTVSKLVQTYTDRHGPKDNLLEFLDVAMDKAARHSATTARWARACREPRGAVQRRV
jgi:ribonuclease D